MPHNTQLANHQRSVARLPAQVVALDPRPQTRQASDTRYLRILQLSDLLSRHLEGEIRSHRGNLVDVPAPIRLAHGHLPRPRNAALRSLG